MAQYGAAEASKSIWDFDPTSIGGCTLWLDGADSSTMFSDSAGTVQSTIGGSVAVWKNKSISGGTALSTITIPTGAFTVPVTGSVTLLLSSTTGLSQGTSVTIAGVVSTGNLTTLRGTFTITSVSGNNITFPNSTAAASVTSAGTLTIAVNNAIGSSTSSTSVIATGATSTTTTISYNVTVNNSHTVGLGMLIGNSVTTTGISPATFNVTNAVISSITTVTSGSVYTIVVNSTSVNAVSTATSGGLMTFTNTKFPTRAASSLSFLESQYLALPNPSLLPTGATNSTRFVVSRTNDTLTRQNIFNNGSNTGLGGHNLQYNLGPGGGAAAPSSSYFLTNAFPVPNGGTQAISELHMITGQLNNLVQSGWYNGNSYPSSNNGDTQALTSVAVNVGSAFSLIGGDILLAVAPFTANSRYLNGNISEILVYNATLSNTDRQIVEGYLAWKWGLQSSLPPSHAYYLNKSVVSSFNPLNFGPTVWLDGKDASTISTKITQWTDKSGNNNHVTQSNLSLCPVYTASGGITFNGVSNQLLFTTPNFIAGVNFTFFVVERRTSSKLSNYFLSGSSTINNSNLHVGYGGYTGANVPFVGFYGNDAGGAFIGTYTGPVTRIFKFNLTTTGRTIYINGTQSGGTNSTVTKLISYAGGAVGGGSQGYYRGDIFEMIFYTNSSANATSFDNDQLIEGYLAWKWGTQASLPSGHPYISSAPINFTPTSISDCKLWLDASDSASVSLAAAGFAWRDKSPSNLLAAIVTPTAATLPTFDSSNGGVVITTPTSASGLTPNFLTLSSYVAYGSIAKGRPGQGTTFWASSAFSSNTDGRTIGNQSSFGHYSLSTTNGTSSAIGTSVGNIGVTSPLWSSSEVINSNTITVQSLLSPAGFNSMFIIGGLIKSAFTTIETSIDGGPPRATFTASSSTMTLGTDTRNLVITPGMTITASYINTGSAIVNSVSGYNVTLSQTASSNQTNVQNYTASSSISTTITSGTYITSATLVTPGSNAGATPTPGTYTVTLSKPVTIPAGNTPLIIFGNNTITRNRGTTDLSATFNPTSSPFLYSLNVTGAGGTASFTINGGSVSSNSVSPLSVASSGAGTTIDFSAVAGSPSYTLYEFINYDISLTTAQRQQVEGYLAWKWGLQASLPSTHPFAPANYFYSNTRPFSRRFVPNDIPNCIMWYDGADLRSMFTDTAGTTQVPGTATGAENRIRLWRDKSGMGNNLTAVNDDSSPTLTISTTNPQRFDVVFDGGDSLLNDAIVNNSSTYTKFLVFYRTNNPLNPVNQFQRLFSYATTAGDQRHEDASGFSIQGSGSQTGYNFIKPIFGGNFTILTDRYYIVAVLITPTDMSLLLNGAIISSLSSSNKNFTGTTFRLGASFFGSQNFPGRINEVISYNRQLSTYEYQEVEGYLAWKWGLRNFLATTHPFYRYQTPSLTPFQPELQLYKDIFDPSDLLPDIWFDPQDRSTIAIDSNGRVTQWRNKGTSTTCSFLGIPEVASKSLNTTETASGGIGLKGPLLTNSSVSQDPNRVDYMDFSPGSFYVSSASITGTTMTLTLGNPPVPLTVTGGSISAFSLNTTSGINTTTLATIYFPEQMVPPFTVGSTINVTGTTSSGTALNGDRIVESCTPFYVTFTLSSATAGTITTQGTITSVTTPNIASVNYTSTSAKQPIMAGQNIATISGMTPSGLNGTTPTILRAGPKQIQFLTNVATGTIDSGGTITSAIIPHNIPPNRQITVSFSPNSSYFNAAASTDFFSTELMLFISQFFVGRGTAYIVQSVPTVNTLTITVPAGLPSGALRLTGGRVDYGEILGSATYGFNNSNTLSSTGTSGTTATINFTKVSRFHTGNFQAGDTITISGVTPITYNGSWYVTGASDTSVTFQTPTVLGPITSTAGSITRTQIIMPSGCFGIRSISVSGTIATVSYNNVGFASSQGGGATPFKVGHAIYIANTVSSSVGNPEIFNGTFTVTQQSSDSGAIGTVQFSISSAAGLSAGTGIICRGTGGSAGVSGAFPTLTCTINPTHTVVTFATQPIIPFVVGQQICIAGTVSSGTNINGIQTVTASTNDSVTFSITSGTGTVGTQGTLSGGTLVVTGGTYSSPKLTLQFTPAIATPFPDGTWVTVYGVLPAANNGFWQVTTGGSTTSVVLTAPTGAGPITNATGNVAFSLQTSFGTMTPHGLSPGDRVVTATHYYPDNPNLNYISIISMQYTVIATPTIYTFTLLTRSNNNGVFSSASNAWNNTVGPVYVLGLGQLILFPISGYCLENTRSQATGGIFNNTQATMLYMRHHIMNSQKLFDSADATVICTSNAVNSNRSNTNGNFSMRDFVNAAAPRYDVTRNNINTRTAGDLYYQTGVFYTNETNGFRPIVLVCNLTPTASNDIPAQTFGHAFAGWRFEPNFRNSPNNGARLVVFARQTAVVTNATWSANVATLTILMEGSNPFLNGNSITVQGVIPDAFNGTFNLTGTPTLTTITYELATNPGAYTAGTGTVSLNTSTSLETNHLRIGTNTSSGKLDSNSTISALSQFYSYGIGEIIGFNRNLSLEERQLLEGWAAQKYNSQTFLVNNQATVRSENSFQISSVSYTGTGPYTYTVTYPLTAAPRMEFCFNTSLTISGCTGTESALNRSSWGVTNASNTTVTFISPTILTSATTVSSANVTSGRVSGTTTQNTFIHPYRTNPVIISPSLDLTKLYTQGLATWFDAANSLTIGFASSNNINSWTSSGGNFTLTLVPSGTNYPTLVQDVQNKLPGVRFASSGTPLGTSFIYPITNFSTLSNNNEFTIITVYKQATFTSSQVISTIIGSADDPRLMAQTDSFSYRNTTTEQTKNYTANVDGQAYISVYYRRESTLLVRDNGITDNGSTTSGTNLNIPSSLGSIFGVSLGAYSVSSPTVSPFAGDIYEHIIFRYALTDQAIYQIEGYLAWKWGLQASLPATHPYYKIRP